MRPTVLIVAERNDAHALVIAHHLREDCDCEPVILDMAEFPTRQLASFELGRQDGGRPSAALADLDLAAVGAVWWRRPASCSVPREYYLFDTDFGEVECDHFLEGLLWSTSCAWVNHPTDEILASRKLHQLAVAARVGLNVPRTIATNDPSRASGFVQTLGGEAIVKRIGTSRGEATQTRLLSGEDRDRLETIVTCPVLLQEYVPPGGDIRVVAVGTRFFAFWIDSASGANPVDSRLDLTVEHSPIELADSEQDLLRELLAALGLTFGVIDLRVSPSGEHYFLEVNPSGQYVYLETLAGGSVSEHVARLLAESAREHEPLAAGRRPRGRSLPESG